MSKKILIATPLYAPDIGGPATYSKLLLEELPSRGYEIDIINFADVRNLPKLIRHIVYFFKIIFKGRHVDLIYALDPVSVGVPAALAAFLLRKRFFVRIAGDYAWEQASESNGITESPLSFAKKYREYSFKVRVLKEVQTEVAKRAEKIIVPSGYMKDVISEWGILRKKIAVIHNSPDPSMPNKDKKTLRGLLHFSGKLIISAGRLIALKRFSNLIDIVPILKKTYPDLKLLIIGEGPEGVSLTRKISKLNLEDSVILTGALQQDVLFGYMQASDVFVLNSIHETFSHNIIESMSLGVPVVATNVGGNPEIIEHNKSGVLVKSGDREALVEAIKKVLEDTAFQKKIIQGAKERVKIFERKHILQQITKELK